MGLAHYHWIILPIKRNSPDFHLVLTRRKRAQVDVHEERCYSLLNFGVCQFRRYDSVRRRPELKFMLTSLAANGHDPDDEIRHEIMNRLLFLFKTARALMWQLLDCLAENETNGSVLRVGIASMQRIAGIDAPRISALTEKIFTRYPLDSAGPKM